MIDIGLSMRCKEFGIDSSKERKLLKVFLGIHDLVAQLATIICNVWRSSQSSVLYMLLSYALYFITSNPKRRYKGLPKEG